MAVVPPIPPNASRQYRFQAPSAAGRIEFNVEHSYDDLPGAILKAKSINVNSQHIQDRESFLASGGAHILALGFAILLCGLAFVPVLMLLTHG